MPKQELHLLKEVLWMKRFLLLGLVLALSVPAMGRDETLIRGRVDSGGFGGPVVKFTQINGEFALLLGGRGGWIIDHTFVLGGAGYGLVNNIRVDELGSGYQPRFDLGYGGLEMEYIHRSRELLHFTISTLIGAGSVNYRNRDWLGFRDQPEDVFFIAEPSANLMMNVTTYFRVGVGASYRFVAGVEIEGLDEAALSGPAASVVMKFGQF
jgi:hypothetical protein